MTSNQKATLLLAATLLTLLGSFFIPPVAQSLAFHRFADTRPFWGIPNFGNVAGNLPFLIIGLYGLVLVARSPVPGVIRAIYVLLFFGVVLTGLGSAYYHWHPDNDTLVWDRIPMTIVFMSFLSATVADLVSRRLGGRLLVPLVLVGVGSVLWWQYTETIGKGDLRLYGWVQFYPMLAIPLLLWLYYRPAVRTIMPSLIWIVVWYLIAKGLEAADYPIYGAIGVSGHSLKHLAAAVSTWYFVQLFQVSYLRGEGGYAPDIREKIKTDFGEKAAHILEILDEAIAKTDYLSTPRIIRCILFLADGNMDKLKKMIVNAQHDTRDVLLWAEYEQIGEPFHPKRIRDFNKTFDECEIDVNE